MKIAYLDCTSGISGDMFVGALLDAGVPIRHVEQELLKIPLKGYRVKKKNVTRCGIKSAKFDVVIGKAQAGKTRRWHDIERIIRSSKVERDIKDKGMTLFRKLFHAESKVHGKRPEKVHLHELGAVDCIVDIFSVLIGVKYLGIEQLYSSSLNIGSGLVHTEHGTLPVPTPATLELLKGVEVYSTDYDFELATPTGALLVSQLSQGFGNMPHMTVRKYGCGAGSMDLKDRPNILRIIIGDTRESEHYEEVYSVETNIDDMNPEHYEYVMKKLFQVGARDVFMTSIFMKKQRPGVQLTVIVQKKELNKVIDVVFRETTTIGVRFCRYHRVALRRESVKLKTRYGMVRCKRVFMDSSEYTLYPEYDDCRRIAEKSGIPIKEVYDTVKKEIG